MRYIFLALLTVVFSSYDLPGGWIKSGNKVNDYEMGIDAAIIRQGRKTATIRSLKMPIKGFGMLTQQTSPEKYRGKRIRLTGYIKVQNVADWAGLCLKVDGPPGTAPLSFDNMYDRAVKGTKDWTRCEIVLDVPMESTSIALGGLLAGTGQIWFDNLNLEVVSSDVPSTDILKKSTTLQRK